MISTPAAKSSVSGPRPFTVYFDTSFWIWLGLAPEPEADEAVSKLEGLGVRYVLSDHLLSELATGPGHTAQYGRMRSRIERLSTDPLRIPAWASWEILFGDEEERQKICDIARIAANTRALVEARSIAIENMTPEQVAASNVAIGLPANPSQEQVLAMIKNVRELMHHAFVTCGINIDLPLLPEPTDNWEETRAALLAWSVEAAQHPVVVAETVRRSIDVSVTAKKKRELHALAMKSWGAEPGKLSNAFRDGGHMAAFAAHEDAIDVLQVDGENFDGLRSVRGHELVNRGLQSRCFRASNLLDAVAQVGAYVATGAFRAR